MPNRALTSTEVAQLEQQGCACDNWGNVSVAASFDPGRVKNVAFSGLVSLGVFESFFDGPVRLPSGINNAALHNCTIGDNVYINRVHTHIANYVIEDNVFIENAGGMLVDGACAFGNGVVVPVLNESGGREVILHESLSAQAAFVLAFYRHRPAVQKLAGMIRASVDELIDTKGRIGASCRITNSGEIRNVRIGAYAQLDGVRLLENGTIVSNAVAPAKIGHNVMARNFIIASGAHVHSGALLETVFVGQGCEIGKHFSAENSLFFANSEAFHGEAVGLFAGPYTVTHHKSTLLIACLASFYNAGSGTNQSNHLYKLGPVHQGIMQRGVKTGSGAYVMWPSNIGAFTNVIGRHYQHIDTTIFPFSYLVAQEEKSLLIPAVNLKSVGVYRDGLKWPKRDRRADATKTDRVIFPVLSPYTVERMRRGQAILRELGKKPPAGDYVAWENVWIKFSGISRAIELYESAIFIFLRRVMVEQLEKSMLSAKADLQKLINPAQDFAVDHWVDLAGLLAPAAVVEAVLNKIEKNLTGDLKRLEEDFAQIYADYASYEWAFALKLIEEKTGKEKSRLSPDDLITVLDQAGEDAEKILAYLREDATKEFGPSAKIGYGLDGDDKTREADFAAVRGGLADNPHLREIEQHFADMRSRAEKCRQVLRALAG